MPKKSKTESLDNFAAGDSKKTINECKGNVAALADWEDKLDPKQNNIVIGLDIAGALPQEVQTRYKSRVKQYLSAVPSEMQKGFLKFGGQIILTGEAEARCNGGFRKAKVQTDYNQYEAKKGNGLADSCFIYAVAEPGTPNAGQEVMVILHQINLNEVRKESVAGDAAYDRNEERILHVGVRSFGLMYAQFFSKLQLVDLKKGAIPNSGNFVLGQTDTFEMANLKENLANRFLLDIAMGEKNKKYSLDTLEPLLGKGSAGLIRSVVNNTPNESDRNNLKLLDVAGFQFDSDNFEQLSGGKLAARKQERANQFKDYVMGEGFDSINCSDKSRLVLDQDFSKTKEVLVLADKGMRDFAAKFIGGYVGENFQNQSLPGQITGTTSLALEGMADGLQTGMMLGMLFRMFSSAATALPAMLPAGVGSAASGCVNGICSLGGRALGNSCTGPNCGKIGGKICSGPGCDGPSGGCENCEYQDA